MKILITLLLFSGSLMAKDYTVNMLLKGKKYVYSPKKLTVKVGDKVKFVLKSGAPHTVTFDEEKVPGENTEAKTKLAEKLSSSGYMMKVGDEHTVDFSGAATGKYGYFCQPHRALGMTGSIKVTK